MHQPGVSRSLAPKQTSSKRSLTKSQKARLQEIVSHMPEDVQKVDEPQLKAMFETSAEVLTGLFTPR
jgi:hypothetical protein